MKAYARILLAFLVLSAVAYVEYVLACVPLDVAFLSIILMALLFLIERQGTGRRRY